MGNNSEKVREYNSPGMRILHMLREYGTEELELDVHHSTSRGDVSSVSLDYVKYANGEEDEYDELDENTLEDLAYAVEMQIEANDKIFRKSQGY